MRTIKRTVKFCTAVVLAVVFMTITVFAEGEMMTIGATGDQVSAVQQMLNNLGYSTAVDGYYGEYTQNSVISFQTDYGLYADGIVGEYTLAALQAANPSTAFPAVTEETPAQSSSSSTGMLSVGSSGDEVTRVQQMLKNLGYDIAVDGDYGVYTASVVTAFQTDKGLYVDGCVGPQTMAALEAAAAETTSPSTSTPASTSTSTSVNTNLNLSNGSTGDDVLRVQQRLMDLGYTVGDLDGYYGSVTEAAVRAFQQNNSLYADGWVGPFTAEVLFGSSAVRASDSASGTTSTEGLSDVQKAARAVLDQVGYDLYAAYQWSVGLNYNINLDIGYQTSQAALYSFNTHAANCVGMAATFCWMARELGYQAVVIEGTVPYARGGYGEHAWVEIVVNGTTYVCDPDFEMQMGKNGYLINYGQSGTWMYNYGYILGD